MPKRKHTSDDPFIDSPSPSKRVTRSKTLDSPQEDETPVKTRRSTRSGNPTPTPSPTKSRRRQQTDASSLKENNAGDESDDPLSALTPTISRSTRSKGLLTTHSPASTLVEHVTPSKPKRSDSTVTPTHKRKTRQDDDDLESPSKMVKLDSPTKSQSSPSKRLADASPRRSLRVVPPHLRGCFNAQRRAILAALHTPMAIEESYEDEDTQDCSPNELAMKQLSRLLDGTVKSGEGNSCLIVGPRQSGKTRLLNTSLDSISEEVNVIRLSGSVHTTDKLAMKELAHQLAAQTGRSFLYDDDEEEQEQDANTSIVMPSASRLPALISILPTLAKPTVVVLDNFDLFALHPRQSLLYCLLDTAQSCRAGVGRKGLCVIGLTPRVDSVTLLEKRVKSRFSGRIIRTTTSRKFVDWRNFVKQTLCAPLDEDVEDEIADDWNSLWQRDVEDFLSQRVVRDVLVDTYSMARDNALIRRILTPVVFNLSIEKPSLSSTSLVQAVSVQRARPRFHFTFNLTYAAMCLLVATSHWEMRGHEVVTFEMLHSAFSDQQRISVSAPVQLEGAGVGMVKCSRPVLFSTFEQLISNKLFITAATNASSTSREFVKHRCTVTRDDIRDILEKSGNSALKKWFSKATSVQ